MAISMKCDGCDGKGWFCDTTYDRSGQWVQHEKCYGTGLSQKIIRGKLKAFVKAKPREAR